MNAENLLWMLVPPQERNGFAALPNPVWICDDHFCMIYVNPALLAITGRPIEEIFDEGWMDLIHPYDLTMVLMARKDAYEKRTTVQVNYRLKLSDDQYIWFSETISPYQNKGINGLIGCAMDIDELMTHSTHDSMTGLYNKGFFNDFLIQLSAQRNNSTLTKFAVFSIDVNDLKPINDQYGHINGDKLIIKVAKFLSSVSRPGDVIARVGGDEFALIVQGRNLNESAMIKRCNYIKTACSEMLLELPHRQIPISIAIGSAIYSGQSIEALLKEADEKMYIDKSITKANQA